MRKNSAPKIVIVLLNWNGKKDTLECLASLEKVDYPNFQPIVVDNGSSDDSVPALRAAFPSIPIFETKANLGFAGGNNIGIAWALEKRAEWILLLNNDTTVAPDFLTEFMNAAKEQPKAKILGAKIFRYGDPLRIDHLGGYWNPQICEFESPAMNQLDDLYSFVDMKQADYVCGAALLMHRTVPETIGLLEPKFFLFWEETDFCFRAKKAGFETWTAPKAHIWHKVSSSFTGGKPHMFYFWWRSRLLWLSRNCSPAERRQLYRSVILPDLFKLFRHTLVKSLLALFSSDPTRRQKSKRLRAGLQGVFDFTRGKFGNCPAWITKK